MRRTHASRAAAGLVLAAAAAFSGQAAQAAPLTYRLDPAHTFVTFEVQHFGTSTLRGRLGPLQGEVVLDREAQAGEVRLTIPLASLSTGVKFLDSRLRERDLLATDEWPDAWFVATNFRFASDGGVQEVRGELTVRGVGTALSLVATRFGCRDDGMLKRQVCGGDFEGDVDRGVFGATFGQPFVASRTHLVVQVEGIAEPR